LRTALATRSFFEDGAFLEAQIATYKRDLKFFSNLRRMAKQDAHETVDFSAYEDQIRKIVDRYVIGEDVVSDGNLLVVNDLAKQAPPEEWSEEKTRNETDIIRTRLTRTIEQDLVEDPYAQRHFSELLKAAIAEASALFDHPLKQYALFKDVEDRVADRKVDGTPGALNGKRHATAYFGIIRLAVGDGRTLGPDVDSFAAAALDIDGMVQTAVAENSLNPANVEAAIRKAVLPRLFALTGLDLARSITDQVVEVTRVGLSREAA
jgi:type I restriction enzyme R subunit